MNLGSARAPLQSCCGLRSAGDRHRQATGDAEKNVQDQDQVDDGRGHGQDVVGREYVSLSDGPRHTARR